MSYILAIICSIVLLAADQYTKWLVVNNMAIYADKDFIPGLISFLHVRNGGGAWGFLSGHTWLLLSMTVVIMLICISMLLKNGMRNKLLFWSVSLILSGGLGNMIDRIFRGGVVVDFIKFDFNLLKDFPVFNVADCTIVIGAALLIVYFIIDIIRDTRVKHDI